jgi:hypothetical protein
VRLPIRPIPRLKMINASPIYDLNRASYIPNNSDFDTREETAQISAALIAALNAAGMVDARFKTSLEILHLHLYKGAFCVEPDCRAEHDETPLMAVLREFAGSDTFQRIYLRLMRRLRREVFDFDFVFERAPVIRCVAPHQLNLRPLRLADGTLMAYHTDMLYADPCGQINCWLPFTQNINSASLQMCSLNTSVKVLKHFMAQQQIEDHIASDTRAKFFQYLCDEPTQREAVLSTSYPLNVPIGTTRFFDMRRLHATADNRELTTRISMDYRIVPMDVYRLLALRDIAPTYTGTALLKGAFYNAFQVDDLY